MSNENRRRTRRYTIASTVEVYYKRYTIELPTQDISATGAGVLSCGLTHLDAGEPVIVTLSPELELNGWIVKSNSNMVHLAFDPERQEEVEEYLAQYQNALLGKEKS
jgi:hypothetical protein